MHEKSVLLTTWVKQFLSGLSAAKDRTPFPFAACFAVVYVGHSRKFRHLAESRSLINFLLRNIHCVDYLWQVGVRVISDWDPVCLQCERLKPSFVVGDTKPFKVLHDFIFNVFIVDELVNLRLCLGDDHILPRCSLLDLLVEYLDCLMTE